MGQEDSSDGRPSLHILGEGSIEIVCDILGIEGLYLAADSAVNAVAAYKPARNHVVARLS